MKRWRSDFYNSLIEKPDVLPVHQDRVKDPDLALVSGAFIYDESQGSVFYSDDVWAYNTKTHVWLLAVDWRTNYEIASYKQSPQPTDDDLYEDCKHWRVVAWCQSLNILEVLEQELAEAVKKEEKKE